MQANLDVQRYLAAAERHRDRLSRWAKSVPAGERRFEVQNVTAQQADMWLYDEIGFDWWTGGGITAKDFIDQLGEIDAKEIILHINSPGGEVFDAIAIFNALKAHPASITTRVEGMAASSASFITMAGDKVIMASHAMMMIHEPFSIVLGPAEDLRKEADVLDAIADNIASIYADKGGRRTNWRQKMRDETWFTDQQAVDAGLADEIDRGSTAPKNAFDLSIFDNVPGELLTAEREPHVVIHNHGTINMTADQMAAMAAPLNHIAEPPEPPTPDPEPTPPEPEPAANSQEPDGATEEEPVLSLEDAKLMVEVGRELART